jgi:hypothetical protein
MVKFFMVVRPWRTYGLVVFAGVALVGLVTIWTNPRELDSALGMALFAQMFVASSGFVTFARRGHFDPALVRGRNRAAALAAHWIASVAPGALVWLLLVTAAYAAGSTAAFSALVGARMAAFLIVSAIAWTIGFALPRGGGGALWMGILLVLLLRHVRFLEPLSGGSASLETAEVAGTLLVCPFLLVGPLRPIPLAPICAAVAAAFTLLLIAWRAGARLDLFLGDHS